jgi:predicted MFS family arabinose efflux permease
VFLLPSLLAGVLLALALGGSPQRLTAVRFRAAPLVLVALALQAVLFSRFGEALSGVADLLHIASYVLLVVFAALNIRLRGLAPMLLGMLLNAVAILANGGSMPVSASAAKAVGLDLGGNVNVSVSSAPLDFLGDVFATPTALPLTNVFSVGDVLIALGAIAFVILNSFAPVSLPQHRLARAIRPLRVPQFRRLAAGRLVSLVGDWLTIAVLVSWLYGDSGSTTRVAILLLLRIGPPILGGSIAAIVVDRVPPRGLAVGIELVRAGAIACAVAGVATDTHLLVYAAVGFSGCCAAFSETLVGTFVPRLLSRDQYAAGNAALGMAQNIAMAIGALGGGLAIASFGPERALLVDVATFVVAALLFSGLPSLRAAVAADDEDSHSRLRGLRYLLRRRRLVVLVGAFAAATFATGLANVTLPRLLESDLGLGPGGYGFGFATLAAGLALGRGAVAFTQVGELGVRWVGIALLGMAACFVGLGLVEHAPTALLLLGAIGFADGTTDVVFDTVVQQESDSSHLGAVFGLSSTLYTTTMVAAVALGPLANDVVASGTVVFVGAAFLALGGAIAFAELRTPAVVTAPTRVPG